jgi:Ser/Thr protein kinase RdoA (MazF antagonist)
VTQSTVGTEAARIARDRFGIFGTPSELPGYEDVNTRIDSFAGASWVLKVSPSTSDLSTVRLAEEAMAAVDSSAFACPRALPTKDGELYATLPDGSIARLHTWADGVSYADRGHPQAAAISIGRTAGEIVESLSTISTDTARSDTRWDLRYCVDTIESLSYHVGATAQRSMIGAVIDRISTVPIDDLPVQVIHGDLNTSNLLLEDDTVVGVIDFGDARSTIRVAELAIACAYAMLHQDDPIAAASQVCMGYREFSEPSGIEATHLFDLILGRLATSVCVAASLPGTNPHHRDTVDATWDLLARLVAADMTAMSDELRAAALGQRLPKTIVGRSSKQG